MSVVELHRQLSSTPTRRLKHGHKRHQKDEKSTSRAEHKFNIDKLPGVQKIVLGEKTQHFMGLVVGEDVTSENPWKHVKRELIEDSMTFNEESEFLDIRLDILTYPKPDILMGYAPRDNDDTEEFYIVLDENAERQIVKVNAKKKKAQEELLSKAIVKFSKQWVTLGSEAEISEYTEKCNRSLYEVEIEADYPVMSSKVNFNIRSAESVRDGYVELLQDKSTVSTIMKKRTDAVVQAAPDVSSRYSQTLCKYPKNAWTQYQYDFEQISTIPASVANSVQDFTRNELDNVCDLIHVNDEINFYTNDYLKLVTDETYTYKPSTVIWEEYMSFTDLRDARNMMIASVCWHPMWSGTVAIAYNDVAPNVYHRKKYPTDEVNRIVYNANPVLIWCLSDGLRPKLYLEAHRQLECVSVCPHDGNIIVGALKNGQVAVWDITNKLDKVEEEEVLTTQQRNYRALMFSMMTWMKITRDISRVRLTAESELSQSHKSFVTGISWLSPFWKMTKTGQLVETEDGDPPTMQFMTCSNDGSVQWWDLLAKPVSQAGDYRRHVRSKRLAKRPSALTMDVSPYKALNRILKPHYRVRTFSSKKGIPLLLSSFCAPTGKITYENPNPEKELTGDERIKMKPILTRPDQPPKMAFYCGSHTGYFAKVQWNGFDVNPGEVVNQEQGLITFIGKYHDGPVTTIEENPDLPGVYLTVGGRVFAIWMDDFKDRPVLWRKSRHRYHHATWNTGRTVLFRLCRSDGAREVWSLLDRTDTFVLEHYISGDSVLGTYTHPLILPRNVIGVVDYKGSFRMFFIPRFMVPNQEKEHESLKKMLLREVSRKKSFIAWQKQWLQKNGDVLKERTEKSALKKLKKIEDAAREKARRQEEALRIEKEELLLKEYRSTPPPGKYVKWAQDQWVRKEEERMNRVILLKKQLNPQLLASQQEPLKNLQKEEERKKKKQKDRLQKSQKIFTDTVATLFPDVIKKKPPPPIDPYASGDSIDDKNQCLRDYGEVALKAMSKVADNPFVYNFDWNSIVKAGKLRRKLAEEDDSVDLHRKRCNLDENKEPNSPALEDRHSDSQTEN